MTHQPTRASDHERGSMTPALAILALALLLVVGLVVDGGRQLNAVEQAYDVAAQAAHTAAQQIDPAAVLTGAEPVLDPARARAAAQGVLAGGGVTGTVTIQGATVTVTATATRPTVFLGLIGIGEVTGTGTATTHLTPGPEGTP